MLSCILQCEQCPAVLVFPGIISSGLARVTSYSFFLSLYGVFEPVDKLNEQHFHRSALSATCCIRGLGNICKVGGTRIIFSSFPSMNRRGANVKCCQNWRNGCPLCPLRSRAISIWLLPRSPTDTPVGRGERMAGDRPT